MIMVYQYRNVMVSTLLLNKFITFGLFCQFSTYCQILFYFQIYIHVYYINLSFFSLHYVMAIWRGWFLIWKNKFIIAKWLLSFSSNYIYIYISLSSSSHGDSTDFPASFSPYVPDIHCSLQALQTISSVHTDLMYVLAGRPALVCPCVKFHLKTSLMSSSLFLQHCPNTFCLSCLSNLDSLWDGK